MEMMLQQQQQICELAPPRNCSVADLTKICETIKNQGYRENPELEKLYKLLRMRLHSKLRYRRIQCHQHPKSRIAKEYNEEVPQVLTLEERLQKIRDIATASKTVSSRNHAMKKNIEVRENHAMKKNINVRENHVMLHAKSANNRGESVRKWYNTEDIIIAINERVKDDIQKKRNQNIGKSLIERGFRKSRIGEHSEVLFYNLKTRQLIVKKKESFLK